METLNEDDIVNLLYNNMFNVYRNTRNRSSVRYFNEPPIGGHASPITEEEYTFDQDDLNSAILLEIVTSFGTPESEKYMENVRKNKLKSISYKKVKENDPLTQQDCSICIESFKTGEYQRTLECKHCFHKKCIDQWFKKDHSDCPLCRAKII